ncbi:hypothetical protein [Komagataeibacter xylinus]|uniref:hypothetical protein n=1 Tax=Komagataeibacter xylinus TaxID=28448 RepID=UPI000A578B34|nr:hypothetical protein [Komagataeibacter xylinus]GBQ78686.1 hypothetical protein AA15237_2771 [Komagataeibacter xylinus NBRC 15237]
MDVPRTRLAQSPDKPAVRPPSLILAPTRPDTPPAQARPCLSHRLANPAQQPPAQQPRKSLFRK